MARAELLHRRLLASLHLLHTDSPACTPRGQETNEQTETARELAVFLVELTTKQPYLYIWFLPLPHALRGLVAVVAVELRHT